jgi:hypothetical protein
MTLEKQQRAVGIFAKFSDVELAVLELEAANLPMIKVSIVCAVTSSLGTVLASLGIPEDERKVFSDLVSQGYYLVIVKGTSKEISNAERILNQNSLQYGVVSSASSLSTGRYKNAVGLFFNQQNTEKAIIELQASGYPMNQVYIVTKGMFINENFRQVKVFTKKDWMRLENFQDIAENYKDYLALDASLIVLGGTDIQIAAARTILEANQVEAFHIYHPLISHSFNNN